MQKLQYSRGVIVSPDFQESGLKDGRCVYPSPKYAGEDRTLCCVSKLALKYEKICIHGDFNYTSWSLEWSVVNKKKRKRKI